MVALIFEAFFIFEVILDFISNSVYFLYVNYLNLSTQNNPLRNLTSNIATNPSLAGVWAFTEPDNDP